MQLLMEFIEETEREKTHPIPAWESLDEKTQTKALDRLTRIMAQMLEDSLPTQDNREQEMSND